MRQVAKVSSFDNAVGTARPIYKSLMLNVRYALQ